MPTKDQLNKLYWIDNLSTHQIAAKFGISQMQVRRWFIALQIPTRTRKQAPSGRPPSGKKNWNWKGDAVSYQALHVWVRRWKGTPMKCEHCGRTDKGKYELANVSKEYLRDLSDWVRLCTACHRAFDKA